MPAVRVKLRELQGILKGDSTPSEKTHVNYVCIR